MTNLSTAMIFAAGRGKRMRPLTDTLPKPLLEVGGKPLIVWQIERLARAGFSTIVINHAWLGELIEAALGNGARWGVRIEYSAEGQALETAGAIAYALPLLEKHSPSRIFVAISGDIFTDYDYRALHLHAQRMACAQEPHMHLVMTPNSAYHPRGDFALDGSWLSLNPDLPRLTFSSMGVYDTRMFYDLPAGEACRLIRYYQAAIAARRASGELYTGYWENIGTPEQLHALDARLRLAQIVG